VIYFSPDTVLYDRCLLALQAKRKISNRPNEVGQFIVPHEQIPAECVLGASEGEDHMIETWTELIHQMHEMGTRTGNCLGLLQKAFINSSRESLSDCLRQLAEIKAQEPELSKKVAQMIRQEEERKVYAEIPKHILGICGHLEILAEMLKKKIDENILFSDRAVTEISFLSQSLLEILNAATDLVLVKNPILVRYVAESETMVEKATIQYATHHEERLIEGLCLPMASSVFLKVLDSLKGIAREAKCIAESMTK
jgi:Na+/phosphate symporter